MEVPDTPACGVRRSILVPGMFGENFMQIGALKGCQDSPHPPSGFLESWRMHGGSWGHEYEVHHIPLC